MWRNNIFISTSTICLGLSRGLEGETREIWHFIECCRCIDKTSEYMGKFKWCCESMGLMTPSSYFIVLCILPYTLARYMKNETRMFEHVCHKWCRWDHSSIGQNTFKINFSLGASLGIQSFKNNLTTTIWAVIQCL